MAWALVQLYKNRNGYVKQIMRSEDVPQFVPAKFDPQKKRRKFKGVQCLSEGDNNRYNATVICIDEERSVLEQKLLGRRMSVPNIAFCDSASEMSSHEANNMKLPASSKNNLEGACNMESLKENSPSKKKKNTSKPAGNESTKLQSSAPKKLRFSNEPSSKESDNADMQDMQIEAIHHYKEPLQANNAINLVDGNKNSIAGKNSNISSQTVQHNNQPFCSNAVKLESEDDEVTALTKQNKSLQNQVKELKKKLKTAEADKETLEESVEDIKLQRNELQTLNMELQRDIINNHGEIIEIVKDLMESNQNTCKAEGFFPAIGSLLKKEQKKHAGRNLWIPLNKWNSLFSNADPREFVRELAEELFGEELKTGNITGKVSNRNKKAGDEDKTVHKLDSNKIIAIRESLNFFLTLPIFDGIKQSKKDEHLRNVEKWVGEKASQSKKVTSSKKKQKAKEILLESSNLNKTNESGKIDEGKELLPMDKSNINATLDIIVDPDETVIEDSRVRHKTSLKEAIDSSIVTDCNSEPDTEDSEEDKE